MTALAKRIKMLRSELGALEQIERRQHARGGCFVMCDLDGFKVAQDAHPDGHSHGDAVLVEFSAFLWTVTRTTRGRGMTDRVSTRLGGDEFIVWCPTELGAARIRDRVATWRSGVSPAVTVSVGIGRTMGSADARLYMDKDSKR